jgi:hypothetical protein
VSGLPFGVKAFFRPGNTAGSTGLLLTATSNATLGYTTLTLVGTSGNLTQTASITLAVNAAVGITGSGTPVDLSSAYNVSGIYTNGTSYNTGGLDGGGFSYSANLLTPSRVADGRLFNFGPPNQPDAVSGTGQPIALPAGQFKQVLLLATGVDGDQKAQEITVTYTDGSTSKFEQSFSDWFTPGDFRGETNTVAMPYRNYANGRRDSRIFNLYGYAFDLERNKTVQSLTLPDNRDLVVLAVTLID